MPVSNSLNIKAGTLKLAATFPVELSDNREISGTLENFGWSDDRIKIDKSFVDTAGSNVRAEAIIKTVIGLGAALSVPVLIEGVETATQLKFAVETECEEVQGFYLGKPMSVDALGDFYAEYQSELTAHNLAKSHKASSLNFKRAWSF